MAIPDNALSSAARAALDPLIRIGGRAISMQDAKRLISSYFNELDNRTARKPFAYPAYDCFKAESTSNKLTDGDLLAPALLNARPTIAAFYSLQWIRHQLEAGLSRIPTDLTLARAVADGSIGAFLGDLVAPLDDRAQKMRGVRLTTLLKVLHRKRPLLIPLYDQFVAACYVGPAGYPVHPVKGRTWGDYITAIATAMSADLESQQPLFRELSEIAPAVGHLRLLDVLAWHTGGPRSDARLKVEPTPLVSV